MVAAVTDGQSVGAKAASSEPATAGDVHAAAKRARKRELLGVARALFLERGFAQTSVSAIVSSAGVAQGTFYLYFKSKHAVLLHFRGEVLSAYLEAFEAAVAPVEPEERADARLVRALREISATVVEQRALIRLFREATMSDELQRVWIEGRARIAEPLADVIRDGCEDGSFSADDPMLTAQLALALFDDLIYEAVEYEAPAPLPSTLAAGTRFLLRALRCAEPRVRTLVPPPTEPRSPTASNAPG
jgi:AcrR family transcriptional regulator